MSLGHFPTAWMNVMVRHKASPTPHTIEDDGNSQQSASLLPQHQDDGHLDGTIFQAPESIAFPFYSASLIQWNATRLPDNLIRCMEVLIDAELSKVFSLPRPRSDKMQTAANTKLIITNLSPTLP